MKILLTGAKGQLGREIVKRFGNEHEIVQTDVDNLDITQYGDVREVFQQVGPQVVIHCAAYTKVDDAESDFDQAFKVNVIGSKYLAAQCLEHKARMVYISTDYVFDGEAGKFYREYDTPKPLNVYGQTKLLGEQAVREVLDRSYIIRTAWLYGEGQNFVRTMLNLARQRATVSVVNDQIGTPTYTRDLAETVRRLVLTDAYGTYHGSCNGYCSWYDFAKEIFGIAGMNVEVEPVATEAFPRPAKRPKFSVLENYMLSQTIGDTMRQWEQALQDYMDTLG